MPIESSAKSSRNSARLIGRLISVLVVLLVVACCIWWGLWFSGRAELSIGLGWATGLVLVPTVISVIVVEVLQSRVGQLAFLVAMTLRLGLTLVGTLLVVNGRPDLEIWNFAVWLLLLYFVAMAVETRSLLQSVPQQGVR